MNMLPMLVFLFLICIIASKQIVHRTTYMNYLRAQKRTPRPPTHTPPPTPPLREVRECRPNVLYIQHHAQQRRTNTAPPKRDITQELDEHKRILTHHMKRQMREWSDNMKHYDTLRKQIAT